MKYKRPSLTVFPFLAVIILSIYGCAAGGGGLASGEAEEPSVEEVSIESIIEDTPADAVWDVMEGAAESAGGSSIESIIEGGPQRAEEPSIESIIDDVEGVVEAFAPDAIVGEPEAGSAPVPTPKGSGVMLRVLILKGQRRVDIEGARGGRSQVEVTPVRGSSTVLVNGAPERLPVSFTPEGEVVLVNGRAYRGRIEVFPDRSGSGLNVVDELDLETYLAGLINYEISAKWPPDAVKTQAVIARTYALYQKRKSKGGRYHIEGSTLGQVYKGINAEDRAALKAVNDTRGQVLTYRGKLALTVYHSNAGGRTDASADVWSGDYRYLRSVRSPYDVVSPDYSWSFTMPAAVLGDLLVRGGYDIGSPVSVKIKARTPGGRARQVRIKDKGGRAVLLEAEKFRKIIGYSALRSTKFKVGRRSDLFVFRGKGSGHGVGLSQWGAKGMAENGYSYKQILRHYYPGTKLKRVY